MYNLSQVVRVLRPTLTKQAVTIQLEDSLRAGSENHSESPDRRKPQGSKRIPCAPFPAAFAAPLLRLMSLRLLTWRPHEIDRMMKKIKNLK